MPPDPSEQTTPAKPATPATTPTATAAGGDNDPVQQTLGVWIDQDLCTGDGLCIDHVPDVFTILEDGIAYCQSDPGSATARIYNDPGGAAELAAVPASLEQDVIHAASVCPGECIFLELIDEDTTDQGRHPGPKAQ